MHLRYKKEPLFEAKRCSSLEFFFRFHQIVAISLQGFNLISKIIFSLKFNPISTNLYNFGASLLTWRIQYKELNFNNIRIIKAKIIVTFSR